MATRVLSFACDIPAGTPSTAPVSVPLALDNWVIERIDLEVPPGPAGLMAFQIWNNGVPFIPYGAGAWIKWDDQKDTYYLSDLPVAGGWACVGYNLDDFYDHTVTLRFHVSPPAASDDSTPSAQVVIATTPSPDVVVTL